MCGLGGVLFDMLVVFENYLVDELVCDVDLCVLVLSGVCSIEVIDFVLMFVIESGVELMIDYGYDIVCVDVC